MKTIAKPFIFILWLTFLYSCSNVPQVSRNKVIGSWKMDKMVSIGAITDTTDQKAIAARHTSSDLSGRELKNAMVDAQKGNFSKLADVYPYFKDVMEFRADNTASMTMHGNMISGTWKMNKNKNGVIFTYSDKTKILKLSIVKVENYSMQIEEKTSIGLIRISYKKDNKK